MRIDISEESLDALTEYASIPIAFEVRSVLDVLTMTERIVETPYVKDYDALEGPTTWPARFDLSHWGLLAARVDGRRVGGAAIAFDTLAVRMLGGRRDVAVLWDIRVAPDRRGQGIGAALFRAAEDWAIAKGCTLLELETQDNNVPACRFYQRMGCQLGAMDREAYPDLPNEARLLWYKRPAPG